MKTGMKKDCLANMAFYTDPLLVIHWIVDVKKKGVLEADMMTANPPWHYVIFVVVFVLSDLPSTATLYSDVSFAAMYWFSGFG